MQQETRANVTSIGMEKLPVDGGRSKIYLHPGQLFASAERSAVSTILAQVRQGFPFQGLFSPLQRGYEEISN
jgi:hypothetical protein